MIYLLGSILFASLIFLIFKLFSNYGVRNLPAIIVNYFTAGIFGFLLLDFPVHWTELMGKQWLPYAVGIGFGFILIFNLMAITTQKLGASATSITVKMSVIIPITAAFFIYEDEMGFLKIAGILLALFGIYYSIKKGETKATKSTWLFLLPLILFLGSGALDTILKFVEETFIGEQPKHIMLLTPVIFISAGAFGLIFFMSRGLIRKSKFQLSYKEVWFGTILGIVNYGSIFCLVSALNFSNWESSMVFPINNVGIVIVTALSSVFIFKEKLSKINIVGIGISVFAILLIAIS